MNGLQKTGRRWWLLLLGAWSVAALAETLPDPTRPPLEISAPAAADKPAGKADSGLQSVIIAPGHRAAIINGQTVELGGKYGDARLVEVGEHGVVLRGPQGKQVLTLFPGVDIKSRMVQPVPEPLADNPVSGEKTSEKKAAPNAVPQEKK